MSDVNGARRIQCNNMVELFLRVNEEFSDWEKVSWKLTARSYTLTLRSSTGLVVVLESSESEELSSALWSMFEEEEF